MSTATELDHAQLAIRKQQTVRTTAKKQNVLLHDVDRGEKCLACKVCPGFQLHFWRAVCQHCHCPRADHDIQVSDEEDYVAWAQLHGFQVSEVRRRRKYHRPASDFDRDLCRSLCPEKDEVFTMLQRRRSASRLNGEFTKGVEKACTACERESTEDETLIYIKSTDEWYHPNCFRCDKCYELFMGLRVLQHENSKCCNRCFSESFLSRCKGCEELIFDDDCIEAEDAEWHIGHFRCWDCDKNLKDIDFTHSPSGQQICLPCYGKKHAEKCSTCHHSIGPDEPLLKNGKLSFHKNSKCFSCFKCFECLEGKPVQLMNGAKLLCAACADQLSTELPSCTACNQALGSTFVELNGARYHERCYSCQICLSTFEPDQVVYNIGGQLMCKEHASASQQREIELGESLT